VKEALLKCMPDSVASALTADALFKVAVVPSRTTGQHALRDLLAAGAVQRIVRGGKGQPFPVLQTLYSERGTCSPNPRGVA
jgi:phosphosulfolactate phosphohydrolase-like enzyme